MAKGIYYKVTVTKNKKTEVQYSYYSSHNTMMDEVEMLYNAGVDTIELEEITKKEYDKHGS